MTDEDPLAAIRRSISTNTKSRVSARPIDSTEETFMGASIGAKPETTVPPSPATVEGAETEGGPALMGNVRRRQKKTARQATAIDPAALAQFVESVSDGEAAEVKAPEPKAPEPGDKAVGGLMLSSPSPTPPPSAKAPTPTKEEPVKEGVKSPIIDRKPPAVSIPAAERKEPVAKPPMERKPAAPVTKSPTVTTIEENPIAPSKGEEITAKVKENDEKMKKLESELAEAKKTLLSQQAILADYTALTESLVEDGIDPTPESLAVFLQPKLDQADRFDALVAERDNLQQELQAARTSLAAASTEPSSDHAVQLADLNGKLAALSDQCAALQSQLVVVREEVAARDVEIEELRRRLADSGGIQVASIGELEEKMEARFKETADFIREMEDFLKEHQADLETAAGGESVL